MVDGKNSTKVKASRTDPVGKRRPVAMLSAVALTAVAGCALLAELEGPPRKENIFAVTQSNRLISFNAGQPARLLGNRPLAGLKAGERVVGIDYRVARGLLYALGASGQLYLVDTGTATAKPVGTGLEGVAMPGDIGFDFNPTVDRIRLIANGQVSARIHPDSGQLVDGNAAEPGVQLDGPLGYAANDANRGRSPRVLAAAYSYNKIDEKITTNYAIDAAAGVLVTQGTIEGARPAVSPNTGQLFTVGALNVGAIGSVAFDIADLNNAAFAAITSPGASRSRWYLIDLESGGATSLGTIGGGEGVAGVAIEP